MSIAAHTGALILVVSVPFLFSCSIVRPTGERYECAMRVERKNGVETVGPDSDLILGLAGVGASIAMDTWVPAVMLGVKGVANAGAELIKSPAQVADNLTTQTRSR